MDRNGNGALSAVELMAAIYRLLPVKFMKSSEISLLMKAFDKDNDKSIEMKEWCAGIAKYKKIPAKEETTKVDTDFDRWAAPLAARKLCKAFIDRMVEPDRAFLWFDKDHSRSITLTELKNGINTIWPKDQFNLGEINMALKYFDANGDGRISRKEWNDTFAKIALKLQAEREKLIQMRNAKYQRKLEI